MPVLSSRLLPSGGPSPGNRSPSFRLHSTLDAVRPFSPTPRAAAEETRVSPYGQRSPSPAGAERAGVRARSLWRGRRGHRTPASRCPPGKRDRCMQRLRPQLQGSGREAREGGGGTRRARERIARWGATETSGPPAAPARDRASHRAAAAETFLPNWLQQHRQSSTCLMEADRSRCSRILLRSRRGIRALAVVGGEVKRDVGTHRGHRAVSFARAVVEAVRHLQLSRVLSPAHAVRPPPARGGDERCCLNVRVVRACGRADVRTCGRAGVRTCGRAGVRACGRADVRACGRAGVRA